MVLKEIVEELILIVKAITSLEISQSVIEMIFSNHNTLFL